MVHISFLLIVVDIISYMLTGAVLSMLWKWFVITTFDLPALPLIKAIGIALVVGLLTSRYTPMDEEDFAGLLGHMLINPLVVLLLGLGFSFFV